MKENPIVTFNNILLKDSYGNKTLLNGEYTPLELSDYLIEQWVSYIECHLCSRSETCSFTIPHAHLHWKKQEIRCGVQASIIKNLVHIIFEDLKTGAQKEQELLLTSIYELANFAFYAEKYIGYIQKPNFIENWGEASKYYIEPIIHLREMLNNAAQNLSKLSAPELYRQKPILLVEGQAEKSFLERLKKIPLYRRKPILLVEGQAEKSFLERLKESHLISLNELRIEIYGGNGNLSNRILMRLEKYREDGYIMYLQGDKDGSEKLVAETLTRNGIIKCENIFAFKFDFESSIPLNILLQGLNNLGYLQDIVIKDFQKK